MLTKKTLPVWAKILIVSIVAIVIATSTLTFGAVSADEGCPIGSQLDISSFLKEDGYYYLSSDNYNKECSFLIEGRSSLIEEHHIWIFSSQDWELKIREGSVWVYPAEWNMDDFSSEKPPIAAEFVAAKRENQIANAYDWDIFVHTINGDVIKFPAGVSVPDVVDVVLENGNISIPRRIEVNGIWNGNNFVASVGAANTITVAEIDNEIYFWVSAKDNIEYLSLEAYTMPKDWNEEEIIEWISDNFPGKEIFSR